MSNNYTGTEEDHVLTIVNPNTFEKLYLSIDDIANSAVADYKRKEFFESKTLNNIVEFNNDVNKHLVSESEEVMDILDDCLDGRIKMYKIDNVEVNGLSESPMRKYLSVNKREGVFHLISSIDNAALTIKLKHPLNHLQIDIGDSLLDDKTKIKEVIDSYIADSEKREKAAKEDLAKRNEHAELVQFEMLLDKYGSIEKIQSRLEVFKEEKAKQIKPLEDDSE